MRFFFVDYFWNMISSKDFLKRCQFEENTYKNYMSRLTLVLCLMKVTLKNRMTDKPVVLRIPGRIKFRIVSFWGGIRTVEKTLGARPGIKRKLNPHIRLSLGLEPRPHLLEVGGWRPHRFSIPAPYNEPITCFATILGEVVLTGQWWSGTISSREFDDIWLYLQVCSQLP